MKLFRALSTTRLVALIAVLAVVAAGSAALAVAASGGGGPTPPAKPLADAIHDSLAGTAPAGITADITFTNKLFPSGALSGAAGSALLSGATGRLWATNDGRGRLELQSTAGDVQIVWNADKVTAYDATSNTVYSFTLPKQTASAGDAKDTGMPPALSEITKLLTDLSTQATVSGAQPDNVANQPAYTVTVSPKHDGGLLGYAQLAFDAARGVPLRVAIYAQGSSTPTLALEATNISYGAVSPSSVDVSPPAGAKVVDLSSITGKDAGTGGQANQVTGLPAVQAAVDFPIAAPDTLVGLPRQHVRLVGSNGALVVYGQGLGAIVVYEHKAGTASASGVIAGLPTVSLNGVTAHELATQLGTVLEWQQSGRSVVLAGSLPPAAAEAAARELK
ncbi:MAG: outer rane lipoprotein carrier protein LolA [Actinomycetia bacterium]|nr:outer rane lipoprotein carrier protein LolA [Actinomycetes bacterium]